MLEGEDSIPRSRANLLLMEGEEARGLADGLRVPDTQTGEFEEGLGTHLSENQNDSKFTVKG